MVSGGLISKLSNTHDNKVTWASRQAWGPNEELLAFQPAVWARQRDRTSKVMLSATHREGFQGAESTVTGCIDISVVDDGKGKHTSALAAVQITMALRSFKDPWVQLLSVSMLHTGAQLRPLRGNCLAVRVAPQSRLELINGIYEIIEKNISSLVFLRYCHKSSVQTLTERSTNIRGPRKITVCSLHVPNHGWQVGRCYMES